MLVAKATEHSDLWTGATRRTRGCGRVDALKPHGRHSGKSVVGTDRRWKEFRNPDESSFFSGLARKNAVTGFACLESGRRA